MKKYLFYAASALAVVGCSNDDYLGNNDGNVQNGNTAILFDGAAGKITRANVGATTAYDLTTLQQNGFWVYGTKKNGSEDQVVYKNYLLKYIDGQHLNYTLSQSKGWEYVGVDNSTYADAVKPHLTEAQTIKYWDYSANSYTFLAATAKPEDLTGGKVIIKKDENAEKYTVTLKDGADLSQLYFADKLTINKGTGTDRNAENQYGGIVKFNFRNALAKVRVAFYETIPGYSVKVNKFYYTNGTETANETNFAADVKNTLLELSAEGTQYSIDFTSGQPILKTTTGNSVTEKDYITLGGNIQTSPLGTDATNATYDYADKAYTWALAQPENTSDLKLKVNYTLTSDDNSGEKIEVKGATATIPADYLKWKNNYAYTYIFKISDKTNGGTGGNDDPKGLYPITFDAAVVETGDGIQQTITTFSKPSITTYGKSAVADEYKSGTNIYVSVAKEDGTSIDLTNENAKLYKVTDINNYDVTEATVANCIENGSQHTEGEGSDIDTWKVQETVGGITKEMSVTSCNAPTVEYHTSIPADDVVGGDAISGKFAMFAAPTVTQTTYFVFEYTETTGEGEDLVTKNYYKVIKVVPNN